VRTLALRTLRAFWEAGHSDAEQPLRYWYSITERAEWGKVADIRKDFPSVDMVGNTAGFNIGGNRYRLVALINFSSKYVLVKWVGTHAEYDSLKVEEL
jgi:mRNA interferase HigB